MARNSMTKQHFVAFAEELGTTHRQLMHYQSETTVGAYRMAIEDVARVCSRFSDRFDRQKFLDACGMPDG